MQYFTNMKDLERHVMNQMEAVMRDKFYKIVKDVWDKHITLYYNDYDPKVYVRTGDFKDKFPINLGTKTNGNTIIWECTFDESVLDKSTWSNKGYSGHHHSDSFDLAFNIVDGYHSSRYKGNTKPLPDTIDELVSTNALAETLKTELKKAGFYIS